MKIEKLSKLPKGKIIQLFEVLRRDQRTVDGLWFLAVEKNYGLDRAVEFDAAVWAEIGRINAQRLKKTFNLETRGIRGLIEAIGIDPLWLFFNYEVKRLSKTEAVMQFTNCPAQEGRKKMGKEVFPCQRVDEGYFTAFAKVIDPRIRVKCGFCPPKKGFPGLWCEWYFTVEEGE